MNTTDLLILVLLYVFLPLWGIAGFVDWCCHRASKIERTSGLTESLMHSVMGIQMAIPIALCLVFRVDVLIMLICIAAWLLHEVVAHWDVKYASTKREISIWEMHAHVYLGSLPLYMLVSIIVINWPVFIDLITFNWQGNMAFELMQQPHGSDDYISNYLMFMAIVCVFPYLEENIRCLRAKLRKA